MSEDEHRILSEVAQAYDREKVCAVSESHALKSKLTPAPLGPTNDALMAALSSSRKSLRANDFRAN